MSFENSNTFKKYKEKYPDESVGAKYFIDTVDLNHAGDISKFVEQQSTIANMVLHHRYGRPDLELVGELYPTPNPREMLYISHITQKERGNTNG